MLQDTHNVRSLSFHPSGDFLLAGTDHHVPHLYDVSTFQCYLSANVQEIGVNSAINQVSILLIIDYKCQKRNGFGWLGNSLIRLKLIELDWPDYFSNILVSSVDV